MHPRSRPVWLALVCGSLLGAAGCSSLAHTDDPAPLVRGPLATRHQQPMALTLLAFRPRRTATQPEGEWAYGVQAAWSDIEEVKRDPSWAPGQSVAFDGETVHVALRTRYGLNERADLEVELPFLYAFGGDLDRLIEAYHDLFSLPDGGRDDYPDDQYDMSVESNGEVLYDLQGNELGVGDVPVFLTLTVREEDERGPGVALRTGVEFPTGSQSKGFGNGALDFGFGLLGERSWERWTFTAGADLMFQGQSSRMQDSEKHRLEDQFSFHLSGEYRWNDHISLVLATIWTSRMINTHDLEEINSEVADVGAGVVFDTGEKSRLSVSIHEDIVAATGADLTVQVGWGWGF